MSVERVLERLNFIYFFSIIITVSSIAVFAIVVYSIVDVLIFDNCVKCEV